METETHRNSVEEEEEEEADEEDDDSSDEVPLELLPDDELEGLPGRSEPEERGFWTSEQEKWKKSISIGMIIFIIDIKYIILYSIVIIIIIVIYTALLLLLLLIFIINILIFIILY